MASIGGDFKEIKVSHPTLGDHIFLPKSNEGNTFDPGGVRTGDDANMITGSGEPIWSLNTVRAFFEVVVANDMNTRADAIFAAKLAGDNVDANWTLSHRNGTVWGLSGRPVGDINPDTNVATFTLKIAGSITTKIVG